MTTTIISVRKICYMCILLVLSPAMAAGQQAYIDSLRALTGKTADQEVKIGLYFNLAKSYRNVSPYFGLDYADSAMKLANELGDEQMKARIINEKGVLYRKVDLYKEAIDQHQKAMKLFQQIGDSMGVAFSMANLGNVFVTIGQNDRALEYHLQSLKMKYDLRDSPQIAYSLRTTALVYQAMKQYDSSIVYLNKALEIYKHENDKYDEGNIYFHLGDVTLESGKSENLSLVYFGKALKIYDDLESLYGTAMAKYEAGRAYYRLNKFDKAREYYEDALALAGKSGTSKVAMDIYNELSAMEKKLGNFRQALTYFENYAALRDSIFNETFSKNIVEMQAKYKNDEQLGEIALLKKQNQLIKNEQQLKSAYVILLIAGIVLILFVMGMLYWRYSDKKRINRQLEEEVAVRKKHEKRLIESEKKLTEVNLTKDKFFSIISHDLKSPFGALKGLVEILQEGFDEMDDEERKELIGGIDKATGSIFSLLTDLLAWSQTQRGTIEFNPVETNLNHYCRQTMEQILPSARKKEIQVECRVPEELMVRADRNMLTTILRNLLSNAVKFTHPSGKITVGARQVSGNSGDNGSNEMVEISVKDNGIGISKENLQKIFGIEEKFKTRGTSNESGTGLGLVICREFVEMHHCKLSVRSKEGEGSTFTFTMPAAKNREVFISR